MGFLRETLQKMLFKSAAYLELGYYSPGVPAWNPRNYLNFAKEGYIENTTVHACIKTIATAAAGINLLVYRKQKNGQRMPLETHPLMTLLNNPNPIQTRQELQEQEVGYYYIAGNSYMAMTWGQDTTKPLNRPPLELWMLRPDLVSPIPDQQGIPRSFQYRLSTVNIQKFDSSRIIHRKTFHPIDPLFGLSYVEAAGREVDIQNAGTDYNYRMLKRHGRPDGAVIVDKTLTDQQYARFKKSIDQKFNNSDEPGGWKLIEGSGAKLQQFMFTPQELGFLEGEEKKIIAICRVFGVPPEVIGISGAKKFANFQEARRALYVETILPLMDHLMGKWNKQLMPLYGDQFELAYEKDDIEALQEDRVVIWDRAYKWGVSGLASPNEARSMVDMGETEDGLGDIRFMPFNVTPVQDLVSTADGGNAAPNTGLDTGLDPALDGGKLNPDPALADPADPALKPNKKSQFLDSLPMCKGQHGPTMWNMFDRTRMGYQKAVAAKFTKQLRADYQAVASAIRSQAGTEAKQTHVHQIVTDTLKKQKGQWLATLGSVYLTVGLDFANRVDKGLQENIGTAKTRKDVKHWKGHIENYIRNQAGDKITGIEDYTARKIMGNLADGFSEDEMGDALAQRVETAGGFTSGRAMNIARTEIIGASNLGSDTAAREFGIPLLKSWLATPDARTREDHKNADGQEVNLDESFDVGGEKLMFPGDGSLGADPSEVCNCRCTQTYSVTDNGNGAGTGSEEGA